MTEILDFLIEFEIWFYVILGLISLIFFSRLFKAIEKWREAAFGLERDIAQRIFRSSLSVLMLIFILVVGEFFFVTYSSSILPDQTNLATPTIDMLASPSPIIATVAMVENEDSFSTTPTTIPDGCIPGEIEWIFPEPASEISGVVQLLGIVNVENFGFYKYEYTEPGNAFWKTIAGDNKINPEDKIGRWNTSQIVPGDYLLRLIVLDNNNNEYPACIVPVRVILSE